METTPVGELLKKKRTAKKKLSEKLKFSHRKPLLGIFLDNELGREVDKKMASFLRGAEALDLEVVVLTDSNLETFSHPNVIILPYSRVNRRDLLEAADMALCFDFNDVEEMLIHGIIPISGARSEVVDYNPNRETGCGFVYKGRSAWSIFAALVRARETFRFPYDWSHLVRTGLGKVGGRILK
ncbi:MAG: hypothetical protein V1679_00015 [Candidatus Peregrinibacteria bacterium]